MPWVAALVSVSLALCSCQEYPFEFTRERRSQARKITEIVKNPVPVDILFVIDNSGSMGDEMALLRRNLDVFLDALFASDTKFQIGVITTDMECNVSSRDCESDLSPTSLACCTRVLNNDLPKCTVKKDAQGEITWTNCDGGYLRSPEDFGSAYFRSPQTEDEAPVLLENLRATIESLDCHGSGMEAGLEAMLRAVACSASAACGEPDLHSRNKGFIREDADLAVIFLTDEDDCSYINNAEVYQRSLQPWLAEQQATHLCSPSECYAYHGTCDSTACDKDGDGLMDWSDSDSGVPDSRRFTCEAFQPRLVNPPLPTVVERYVEALAALKGYPEKPDAIKRVRAAGIVSAVEDATAPLGYKASHCFVDSIGGGPSSNCGCWTANPVGTEPEENFFCALTDAGEPFPEHDEAAALCGGGTGMKQGCAAMTSGRYVSFLETLAAQRVEVGKTRADTLVDSICRDDYSETLFEIVNTVVLTTCFELVGSAAASPDDIQVTLNGQVLPRVDPGSAEPGWSTFRGGTTVCLEGGLRKEYNDVFEILMLVDDNT